jgi:2-oxoglutarate ferredoxin oxidoreductase subunit alpha
MAEVPVVIVNVMRGGPSTGSPTMPAQGDVMQARWGTHGDHPIVVLVPNSVRESFDLAVRSFNLAERLRTPVILLLDEIIGHVNEKLTMPESVEVVDRKGPDVPPAEYKPYRYTEDNVPPMAAYGRDGYRFHVTGLAHDETGFPTNNPEEIEKLALRLHAKLERYRDEVVDIERVACDDAEIGIFAYGATSRSAYQTVRDARAAGIKVGLLRPRTLWPFPDREVHAFAKQVRTIIVPELNLGQMAHEVEWAAAGACLIDPLMRIDGQPISPRQILERVERAAKGDHL